MFVVVLKYRKSLEEVDALLPAHVKFLDEQYAQRKFICSGRRNPRIGGVIIANVNSQAELQKILEQDPFYKQQAAEYETIEFTPTKMDERFSCFMETE
ncbi:YciI family protein [Azotosporobacter soli]|uniref:YciI family protein n=1 Tax=Azotosporobacter soli TaxID=3055040 RepID=UPI0031FEC9B1